MRQASKRIPESAERADELGGRLEWLWGQLRRSGLQNGLTKEENTVFMEHGKCRIGRGACVEGAEAYRSAPLTPALCSRSTRPIWPPHATTSAFSRSGA